MHEAFWKMVVLVISPKSIWKPFPHGFKYHESSTVPEQSIPVSLDIDLLSCTRFSTFDP